MKTKFNALLAFVFVLTAQLTFAQNKTITGTVSDESGPLPGVSVLVQGTNMNTQTDFDGKYSIEAKDGDVLVFTYVGMKTASQKVSGSTMNVTMESDNLLDEVVVTALGIKRDQKAVGYAAQGVDAEELVQTQQTNVNTALAGKVSGVQMKGQPSSTFSNPDIRLRGTTGVLYVVDGVKLSSSTDVITEDIESLEVMKGLAATALYGPDGKNGAIIITTKRAKNGQAQISWNTSVTFDNVYIMPDYQDQYGGGYNDGRFTSLGSFVEWEPGQFGPEYYADESWGPELDGTPVRHWDSWIEGDAEYGKLRPWSANPDNIKNFYQTGITTNNQLSFSKGGEDYSIRSAVQFTDQSLIVENSKRTQMNYSIKGDYNITDKLKFNTSFTAINRNTENNPQQTYGNTSSNFNQWWQRQLDMDRLKDYNRNGQMVSWNINSPTNTKPLYWDSPYFAVYENTNEQQKNAYYGQMTLAYDFTDNFSAAITGKRQFNQYTYNTRVGWGGLDMPYYREDASNDERDEILGIATYSNNWGDWDLTANAGFELTDYRSKYLRNNTVGGMTAPGFFSISTSKDRPNVVSSLTEWKNNGWFAKASVGYKDFLYLEGTYRNDWRSTAAADDNKVTTYGISGSFVVTELFDNGDAISFAKIRGGYAQAPDFPGAYQLSQTYDVQNPYGSNGALTVPNSAVNPLLKGGSRNEFETGLEMRFAKNRVGFDITYYERKLDELPSWVTLPGETGFTGFYSNQGKETTQGWELTIDGDIVRSDDFSWNLMVNMSGLTRTVDYIADGVETNVLSSRWGTRIEATVGEQWGAIYGRAYARDENGTRILDQYGRYTYEEDSYLGSVLPDFTGGILSGMKYKNWELDLGFDFQMGGNYFGVSRMFSNYSGLSQETVGNNVLGNPRRNPIIAANGINDTAISIRYDNAAPNSGGDLIEGVDADGNAVSYLMTPQLNWAYRYRLHEEFLNDASYIKLRSLRLGYSLPAKWLDNTGISGVNLAFIGNNLWLISSALPSVDPSELEGNNGIEWFEDGQMPSSRSLGFNAKITF